MTLFETRPLESVAKFYSGGTPSKANSGLWRGSVPWLTPKDMAHWDGTTEETVAPSAVGNGTRLAPGGSCFVAVRGMSLHNEIRIIHSVKPLTFNQDVKAIVASEGIDARFLYYVLTAKKQQLLEWVSSAGHGTGVLSTDLLKSLPVPCVSAAEQFALAATFSDLDDKIELNRRMNETLEAMAQAIFRDWFVDFGPTRRKIEGATDPVEVMGGLVTDLDGARHLADLFPASIRNSGLPDGWAEGDLGQYAVLNPESWSARNAPREVDYVDLANTKWGTIETTTIYAWPDAPSRARRIVRVGDTIVGTVRPGNGSYSYVGVDGLTASTGFAALRPKRKTMAELVYFAATSSENIARLDKLADGGAYPAVRPDVVLAANLPVVPSEIVEGFSTVSAPLVWRIEHSKRESQTLAATRDLLLPQLMSGEIRLRDAQEQLEAAQ